MSHALFLVEFLCTPLVAAAEDNSQVVWTNQSPAPPDNNSYGQPITGQPRYNMAAGELIKKSRSEIMEENKNKNSDIELSNSISFYFEKNITKKV